MEIAVSPVQRTAGIRHALHGMITAVCSRCGMTKRGFRNAAFCLLGLDGFSASNATYVVLRVHGNFGWAW